MIYFLCFLSMTATSRTPDLVGVHCTSLFAHLKHRMWSYRLQRCK